MTVLHQLALVTCVRRPRGFVSVLMGPRLDPVSAEPRGVEVAPDERGGVINGRVWPGRNAAKLRIKAVAITAIRVDSAQKRRHVIEVPGSHGERSTHGTQSATAMLLHWRDDR